MRKDQLARELYKLNGSDEVEFVVDGKSVGLASLTVTDEERGRRKLTVNLTEPVAEPEGSSDASLRWQAEYEAAQAALEEQVAACRYCKAAKTRAKNRAYRLTAPDARLTRSRDALLEDAAKAMCKEHRSRSRLNYVCSPVSETYWSS